MDSLWIFSTFSLTKYMYWNTVPVSGSWNCSLHRYIFILESISLILTLTCGSPAWWWSLFFQPVILVVVGGWFHFLSRPKSTKGNNKTAKQQQRRSEKRKKNGNKSEKSNATRRNLTATPGVIPERLKRQLRLRLRGVFSFLFASLGRCCWVELNCASWIDFELAARFGSGCENENASSGSSRRRRRRSEAKSGGNKLAGTRRIKK